MAKLTAKPTPAPLLVDTPAAEAARQAVADLLTLARGLEGGIVDDDDTEFVHQHRVCLRKARSLTSVLEGALRKRDTKRLRKGLKAATKATNRLRDLDVFLEERSPLEARVTGALRPSLAELFDSLQAERDEVQGAFATRLSGDDWQAALDALAAAIGAASPGTEAGRPVQDLVRQSLTAAADDVLRRGRAIDDDTPDDEVHDLRLACKALRYTLEPAAPLLGPRAVQPVVKHLKRLQDVLGRFNDLAVQQETVLAWLHEHAPSTPGAAACGALVQALHGEQRAVRGRVLAAISNFDTPKLTHQLHELTGPPPSQEER